MHFISFFGVVVVHIGKLVHEGSQKRLVIFPGLDFFSLALSYRIASFFVHNVVIIEKLRNLGNDQNYIEACLSKRFLFSLKLKHKLVQVSVFAGYSRDKTQFCSHQQC